MTCKLTVLSVPAPAHWASYLVNDDASSLSESDAKEADAWFSEIVAEHPFAASVVVVGCSEESYVARFNGLQSDLLDYTIHVNTPSEVTVTLEVETLQRALGALLLAESSYHRFADQATPLSGDAFRNRVEARLVEQARNAIISALPKIKG